MIRLCVCRCGKIHNGNFIHVGQNIGILAVNKSNIQHGFHLVDKNQRIIVAVVAVEVMKINLIYWTSILVFIIINYKKTLTVSIANLHWQHIKLH